MAEVTMSTRPGGQARVPAQVLPEALAVPEESPMRLYDWVFLNAGDRVVVQLPDGRVHAGVIDAVANDASLFWLWVDGGGGRAAVFEEDACKVWKSQNWLRITSCGSPAN